MPTFRAGGFTSGDQARTVSKCIRLHLFRQVGVQAAVSRRAIFAVDAQVEQVRRLCSDGLM